MIQVKFEAELRQIEEEAKQNVALWKISENKVKATVNEMV